jgi:ATP-binding cassette subfamily F protein uup
MIYLAVEKLSKNYPEQPLFDDLTFGIFRGEKIALIANNGAGKSSLIKILAGQDTPDSGTVHVTEGIRLGILQQDPQYPEDQTVQDIIEDAHREVRDLVKEYEKVLQQQDGSDQAIALLTDVSAKMELINAWDYDRDLKTFLTR